MIYIYYHRFTKPFSKEKWTLYLEQMPQDVQTRIGRYFKEENKYQLLIGRMLLKQGMKKLGYEHFKLEDLSYDEFNCPRWKADMQFNIAHSGNIVGCAFSKRAKIGLDIEQIKPVNLKDFKHILNAKDYQSLQIAEDKDKAFFKIWTIKEAVTKALGKGLAIDVKYINIFEEYTIYQQQKWWHQSLDLKEGFACHLVSSILNSKVILKEVNF